MGNSSSLTPTGSIEEGIDCPLRPLKDEWQEDRHTSQAVPPPTTNTHTQQLPLRLDTGWEGQALPPHSSCWENPFPLVAKLGRNTPSVKTCSGKVNSGCSRGECLPQEGSCRHGGRGESLVLLPVPPVPLGSGATRAFSPSRVADLDFSHWLFLYFPKCLDLHGF